MRGGIEQVGQHFDGFDFEAVEFGIKIHAEQYGVLIHAHQPFVQEEIQRQGFELVVRPFFDLAGFGLGAVVPDAEYGHGFAVVFFIFGGRAFGDVAFVRHQRVERLAADDTADKAVVFFVFGLGEHDVCFR